MNTVFENPVDSQRVRTEIKLHSIKNIVGVLSLLEDVCGGERNLPHQWRELEKRVIREQRYEAIPDAISEWTQYLRTLNPPEHLQGRFTDMLQDLEVKIREIEQELMLPDDRVHLTRLEFKERILKFFELANSSRSNGSVETVFHFKDFRKSLNKLVHIELPSASYTYPRAFKAALRNLVANARKFTDVGGVIHVFCKQDENGVIALKVEDNGLGIPSDELHRVTEPNYRASNNKRKGLGYGVGLSMVQQFVDEKQGSLSIESALNAGTRVSMSFNYG